MERFSFISERFYFEERRPFKLHNSVKICIDEIEKVIKEKGIVVHPIFVDTFWLPICRAFIQHYSTAPANAESLTSTK